MELRQLRAVEAVERLRHFTRAAKELHVVQSALSHQVRQLERELGTPLFERTSRRVRPTQAGSHIAQQAREVFTALDQAVEEIDELRGLRRGTVRIGALHPAGELDVAGLVAGFSHTHPGIEVRLHEGTASDMLHRLTTGELDVAFCLQASAVPAHLSARQLGEEEVVVAYAPGQAPPSRSVPVGDLAAGPLIAMRRGSALTSAFEASLAAYGHKLHLALESGDPALLRSLAARGFAPAILSRSITNQEGSPVEIRRLRPALRLPIILVWRQGQGTGPAVRAFIESVIDTRDTT